MRLTIKELELDSAIFELIKPQILRVTVYNGIEVDMNIAKQYRQAIKTLVTQPTGLLVDKRNSYSLDFNAQRFVLNNLPNIAATALLVHSSFSSIAAETQLHFLRTEQHQVQIFSSQRAAVKWLGEQLEASKQKAIKKP